MSAPAIRIEGLSKAYRVGAAQSAPGTFYELLSGLLSRGKREGGTHAASEFLALRDVDLEIAPGEVLGVVGRNGAGKSTLLKILARITAPTAGRVTIRGRVASLLEVGTGFHPELTGRENIFLNATILGMKRAEIERKLDAIIDFSGVEKFIDTPVKRYSSGMYVRLAFAVAAHVDADVLLVDEVLAVGDAEFQKRCLGTMTDVARRGRTVLFVSHNLTALANLCSAGVLLKDGRIAASGPIAEVLDGYTGRGSDTGTIELAAARAGQARISRVTVRAADNRAGWRAGESIPATSGVSIDVDVELPQAQVADVFLHCYNEEQVMVFSGGSFMQTHAGEPLAPGRHRFTCNMPGHLLNDGAYSLDVMLLIDRHDTIDSHPSVISFQVSDDFPRVPGWHWRPRGTVRPLLQWKTERTPC
jgi:lipopolysaccharide transport system ATP-binding protein